MLVDLGGQEALEAKLAVGLVELIVAPSSLGEGTLRRLWASAIVVHSGSSDGICISLVKLISCLIQLKEVLQLLGAQLMIKLHSGLLLILQLNSLLD